MLRVPTPRALPSLSLRWCWYYWGMHPLERGKRRCAFRVRPPFAHTGDGDDDDGVRTKRCWLCWCCAGGRWRRCRAQMPLQATCGCGSYGGDGSVRASEGAGATEPAMRCRGPNAKCRVPRAELQNAECQGPNAKCRVPRCRRPVAEGRTPEPGTVGDEAMPLAAASRERERNNAPGGAGGKKTKEPPRRRMS
jgi:hypothetical protein